MHYGWIFNWEWGFTPGSFFFSFDNKVALYHWGQFIMFSCTLSLCEDTLSCQALFSKHGGSALCRQSMNACKKCIPCSEPCGPRNYTNEIPPLVAHILFFWQPTKKKTVKHGSNMPKNEAPSYKCKGGHDDCVQAVRKLRSQCLISPKISGSNNGTTQHNEKYLTATTSVSD